MKKRVVDSIRSLLSLVLLACVCGPAGAYTLQGEVEQKDLLSKPELKAQSPKEDSRKKPFAEDMLDFSPERVEAKEINGTWKVVDGDHWMLDFGSSEQLAQRACEVIKHYGYNKVCFVGRNSGVVAIQYFLVDGWPSRQASFPGDPGVSFDNAAVQSRNINGHWTVTAGETNLADFEQSKQDSDLAAQIIRFYGFNRQSTVSAVHPRARNEMMYFTIE